MNFLSFSVSEVPKFFDQSSQNGEKIHFLAPASRVACTEMTINNKIRTPQVVLIVGLSWASNDITFGLKKLHLAVRALP